MNRRRFLATSGGVLVASFAGCLSDSSQTPNTDDSYNQTDAEETDDQTHSEENSSESDSQDERDDCVGPLEPKSGYGRADPINEDIEVDEIKDAERKCEKTAFDIIFTQMKGKTDLDDVSDEKNWLSSSVTGGRITLIIRSETNQNGTLVRCPPIEYQYEDVVASVPKEITITLQSDDDSFTWSRKVVIEHRHSSLD
ncbi:hypothetical protein [Halobiforma nitratireducens]|uniref:Uncharacterized protein n=1 Tax=Halobiforma nitratireducens JCM 10879 TaxID=1227454 RepID=M0LXY3_9EURY|nr:hypothetical protein [Halobiforma nitratireducens]EMA37219.1 hypothetical protein C446_10930 [Halobiforma nitratireducens JCM 10879]